MSKEGKPVKSNLLPFPSLQPAPRDRPKDTAWRALGLLVVIAIALGLVWLTLSSLVE